MNRTNASDLLRSVEKHKEVMKAYASGADIQRHLGGEVWEDAHNPHFLLSNEYRIKPKTPLQIPWELIENTWNWAAKNSSGRVFLYQNKPHKLVGCFRCNGGLCCGLPLVDIDPDNISWEESLVQRPYF